MLQIKSLRRSTVRCLCALASVAVLAVHVSAQDATPKPRMTSDKQPLPDAVPRMTIVKIQTIGTKLDALPEEACGRVWGLDTDIDFVSDARHALTDAGVDLTGFNYLGDGIGEFTRSVLKVENGRVRAIILYRGALSQKVADSTIAKIASDTQEAPKHDGKNAIKFRMKGIHFYEREVGHWEKFFPGEHHYTLSGQTSDMPGHTDKGPAGIEVGIEDDDWQAMNVCNGGPMLQAVQEGRLVKGMRPVEAYLAMKGHRLYRQMVKGQAVWTWTDTHMDVQSYSTVSDEFGTRSSIHYANHEQPFARVTFQNGVVDTIDDETTLTVPPDPSKAGN